MNEKVKAKLTSAAAILLTRDVVYTANWYSEKLGFNCLNLYGNPPDFAILHRDGNYIMFRKAAENQITPNWKYVKATSNVYFWVDNVAALFEEFTASGATIDYGLCIQPYGIKEFGINDPDGYDIAFGEILK